MTEAEKLFFELMEQGVFEIDEQGQIWRTATCYKGHGTTRGHQAITPRRAERENRNGYLAVRFCVDSVRYFVMAHRVVWIHFFGSIPEELEVNHKWGAKTDNRPAELELMTPQQNVQHAWAAGLSKPQCGESNGCAKLTADQVEEIRRRYAAGNVTQTALAREYGVSRFPIWAIVHNKKWTHVQPAIPVELPISIPTSETIMEVS
jgi:hypothetical protein